MEYEFKHFNLRFLLSSQKNGLGIEDLRSEIRDPGSDFRNPKITFPDPDPGVKKAPDPALPADVSSGILYLEEEEGYILLLEEQSGAQHLPVP
jgi:hypothetical protein